MSAIEVERLLADLSADSPCGEDLEYDPAFGEMERAAQGRPEQQIGETIVPAEEPDWRVVRELAGALLGRSKDLRAAVLLTRALINTAGLPGLRDGLRLIGGLLERHWDGLHPRLDPDDGLDPTLRLNSLLALSDPETTIFELRRAPLVRSRGFGTVSLRDLDLAAGRLQPAEGAEPPEAASLEAAFMEVDLDELRAAADAAREAAEAVGGIEGRLAERVGASRTPDLEGLSRLLREARQALDERLGRRGVDVADSSDAAATPGGIGPTVAAAPGEMRTREDVTRALDAACDWFRRNEPSSPVPLLLQRAKRLVSKDFLEIIRDMAPDGVAQAEVVLGCAREES